MNDMTNWLWFAGGLAAGFMHATMLWQAAKRLTAWTPVLGMLRLGLVAAVLVLSAFSGVIFASAAGWAIGLAMSGAWFFISGANPTVAPSKTHSNQP